MEEKKSEKKDLKNTVLVSRKPLSAYILAARNVLQKYNDIVILARGKNINTAVNLAEIIKRDGLKVQSIEIGTEKFIAKEDNREVSISSIDIKLAK